ncbi:hypothetical protein CXB49_07475 [Chromobacterium sp. ATCC 53434]|nr:hypothetical protein CXB49_07475 [Chromobacterium sp. ATCC 53434]
MKIYQILIFSHCRWSFFPCRRGIGIPQLCKLDCHVIIVLCEIQLFQSGKLSLTGNNLPRNRLSLLILPNMEFTKRVLQPISQLPQTLQRGLSGLRRFVFYLLTFIFRHESAKKLNTLDQQNNIHL